MPAETKQANNSHPRFRHKVQLGYEDFCNIDDVFKDTSNLTENEIKTWQKVQKIIAVMKASYSRRHSNESNAA